LEACRSTTSAQMLSPLPRLYASCITSLDAV
jgi:hypothetical protein